MVVSTTTLGGTTDVSAQMREWPGWQVPATARGEWLALKGAIVVCGVCLGCEVDPGA